MLELIHKTNMASRYAVGNGLVLTRYHKTNLNCGTPKVTVTNDELGRSYLKNNYRQSEISHRIYRCPTDGKPYHVGRYSTGARISVGHVKKSRALIVDVYLRYNAESFLRRIAIDFV
jgi:hypothetical protein